jgi:hypothetical protein
MWEEATDSDFIPRHHEPGRGALVSVSAAEVEHLRKYLAASGGQCLPPARR